MVLTLAFQKPADEQPFEEYHEEPVSVGETAQPRQLEMKHLIHIKWVEKERSMYNKEAQKLVEMK